MDILITNDDGIGAPGLELLDLVASRFGKTTVVAPKVEQSGVSHKLTFDNPLEFEALDDRKFQVNGTPGDCIRVALASLNTKFDWVLSGVNDGANMGVEIYYSGTVAAAREATILGFPAIALSQYRRVYSKPFSWDKQVSVVQKVLHQLFAQPPSPGSWTNINLPDAPNTDDIQIVECEPDMSPLPNQYLETEQGMTLRFSYRKRGQQPGMDVATCFGGQIALSRHRIGER